MTEQDISPEDPAVILERALKLEGTERDAYLEMACGGNTQLRMMIVSMIAVHARQGEFLAEPTQAVSTEQTAATGMVIGPYKLREVIGEGGMGLVYVADQQKPVCRKVAVKVIKPGMDTHEVVARFEAERQALALMDHPNIAKVLDAGATESGRPYFVMELIRGTPILEYCDAHKLTTQERLKLFNDACRAVQHAHSKGVIHRDLKPNNILVSPHDGVPVVKVIDFGIAKAIGQRLTDHTIYTRLTQMIGTPLYMSPEQAEINALDVDTRSDVYSLGVLLYELLTGATPFDRERFSQATYDEIKRIIREEEPLTPSKRLSTLGDTLTAVSGQRKTIPARLVSTIKGELDWIVMRCLEKDRSRRYQTAADLAADVERFLCQEPVLAAPPSRVYKARKFIRKHRALLGIAISFFVVLLGFASIQFISYAEYKAIAFSLRSKLTDEAINKIFNGEREPALGAIDNAVKVGLDDEFADTLRGIAYYTSGEIQKAVDQLERLTSRSQNRLASAVLVWTYYESGELAQATRLLERLPKSRFTIRGKIVKEGLPTSYMRYGNRRKGVPHEGHTDGTPEMESVSRAATSAVEEYGERTPRRQCSSSDPNHPRACTGQVRAGDYRGPPVFPVVDL